MKTFAIYLIMLQLTAALAHAEPDAKSHLSPDVRFGDLFSAVQLAGIYPDSKTFADSTPKYSTDKILADYQREKIKSNFDLADFVSKNFTPPANPSATFKTDMSQSATEHINNLWSVLTRQPQPADNGSLIPLPHSYVVPGGRFREIYYWDSYFTMLGLQTANRWDLIENMVDNFAYLIDTIGFIPNGNRTYYQTRSQPPFFSLMVELLAEKQGKATFKKYQHQLQKEYDFWMDGAGRVAATAPAYRRLVRMPNGSLLNRYWDDAATPRPESYREDIQLVQRNKLDPEKYRDIRAAAESGWDFSSRWFSDKASMETIHTTEIIPVDLNSLLYHLELTLAEAYQQSGEGEQAEKYRQLAQSRQQALFDYCWNNRDGFFYDYDFAAQQQTGTRSLAAAFPLFFKMAKPEQARRVAKILQKEFLKPGGLTTTTNFSRQQWDAPNGWAPLQWVTLVGLNNYQQTNLAKSIQMRWSDLNIHVYKNTGKMVEKYNVYEIGLEGGGGEYPVQDGFGWTNGVLLKMLEAQRAKKVPEKAPEKATGKAPVKKSKKAVEAQ